MFPKPAELLERRCLIPVSGREYGGAGVSPSLEQGPAEPPSLCCKVQTWASPDFGNFGTMGPPGAALQTLSSLPRMDFSQMLRKRCSLSLLENQE